MNNYKKLLITGSLLLLLASLSIYAWVGTSTLMMADDYCYLGMTRTDYRLFDVIKDTYTESVVIAGNRYSSTGLSLLVGYLGAQSVQLMPVVYIFGLMLSVYLLVREALPGIIRQRYSIESVIAGGLFAGTLLYISPSHFQNIYWFSGIVAYCIPIICYCLLMYITIKNNGFQKNGLLSSVGALAFAIVTAGFSETSAAAFFTLTVLLYASGLASRKINYRNRSYPAAIAGLAIGILLLVISPSAISRHSGMNGLLGNKYDSLVEIVRGSFQFGFDFIIYQLKGTFLPLAVLLVGMLVIGSLLISSRIKTKQLVYGSLLIVSIVYLSISASMAPQIFAFGAYPNERSQLIPLFILVSGISCTGLLFGMYLPPFSQRYQSLGLLVLLLASVYVLRTGLLETNYRSELVTRRLQWEVRNQQVLQSIAKGERDLIVSGIDSIGTISDFNPVCFRDYYQLNSVDVLLE